MIASAASGAVAARPTRAARRNRPSAAVPSASCPLVPKALIAALLACLIAACAGAPETPIRLVAGGDVAFGRETRRGPVTIGDPDGLSEVVPRFRRADLVLVNLESPLCALATPTEPLPTGEWDRPAVRLRAPPAVAEELALDGVDVVSLANNHALDCGLQGLETTLAALEAAGVVWAGVSLTGDPLTPAIVSSDGPRLAVLAATPIESPVPSGGRERSVLAYLPQPLLVERVARRIRELRSRSEADVVVVSLHWGQEGRSQPTDAQVEAARALVDAGADLVVGHHSHVLQPIEAYGDGLIIYSAGNLLFDMREPETRATALFEVEIATDASAGWHPTRLWLQPLRIGPDGAPRPISPELAEPGLSAMLRDSCDHFATCLRRDGPGWVWVAD